MSIGTRLAAMEKAVSVGAEVRREYSHTQILTAARMMRAGVSREEAWAAVGPPEAPLMPGEPSVAQLVVQTRRRAAYLEVERAAERAVRGGQPIARLLAAAGFRELAELAASEWKTPPSA